MHKLSVNKLLSKLVGNVNKPMGQTTLMLCPCDNFNGGVRSVTEFLDVHDISQIPGVGFKSTQCIRQYLAGRERSLEGSSSHDSSKVSVRDVRQLCSKIGPGALDRILHGIGGAKGVGGKIFELVHGIDNADVAKSRAIPTQISIEDSYPYLNNLALVERELVKLSKSLITRMYSDLSEPLEQSNDHMIDHPSLHTAGQSVVANASTVLDRRWLAIPRTLRISTRSRPIRNFERIQPRLPNRVSRSVPLPSFILNYGNLRDLSLRLVKEVVFSTFKKLHPTQFEISLINLAVTNIVATAGADGDIIIPDISRMFKQQGTISTKNRPQNESTPQRPTGIAGPSGCQREAENSLVGGRLADGSDDKIINLSSSTDDELWDSEDQELMDGDTCNLCGVAMPDFAKEAHFRFHEIIE